MLGRHKALQLLSSHTTRRWLIQKSRDATFDTLGLSPQVLSSLREAFPNVQTPTAAQAKFIPAILSRKDVLLKDLTGAGK